MEKIKVKEPCSDCSQIEEKGIVELNECNNCNALICAECQYIFEEEAVCGVCIGQLEE